MPTIRRIPALVLALALATPGAAFAQSAGDEQYSDPFQDVPADQNQGNSGSQGGGNQGGQEPAPAPAPAPAPEPAPSPLAPALEAPVTPEAGVASASAGPTLPRSGLPLAVVGGAGLVLLAGGAALRRAA